MQTKKKKKKLSKGGTISAYSKVKKALEDNRYKYRTLKGVARSAGVSIEQVNKEIISHPKEVVILSRKNQSGERLYTTRKHYSKKASTGEKLMGALINGVY